MASSPTNSDAGRSFFIFLRDTLTSDVKRIAIPADTQIGLRDDPAELQVTGRFAVSVNDYVVTAVASSTSSVTIDEQDTVSNVYVTPAASSSVNALLPSHPRHGTLRYVNDAAGTSDQTPIVVSDPSGASIDGQPSWTLSSSYASVGLCWAGSFWKTIGGNSGGQGGLVSGSFGVQVAGLAGIFNTLNFTGSVSVADAGGGTATINVVATNGINVFTASTGNPVANNPHSGLVFKGSGVSSVTDAGSGNANVDIERGVNIEDANNSTSLLSATYVTLAFTGSGVTVTDLGNSTALVSFIGNTGWATAIDVNYASLTSQAFSSDGSYTLDGYVHSLMSSSANPVSLVNGQGLVFSSTTTTNTNYPHLSNPNNVTIGNFSVGCVNFSIADIASYVPDFNWYTPVRVTVWVESSNLAGAPGNIALGSFVWAGLDNRDPASQAVNFAYLSALINENALGAEPVFRSSIMFGNTLVGDVLSNHSVGTQVNLAKVFGVEAPGGLAPLMTNGFVMTSSAGLPTLWPDQSNIIPYAEIIRPSGDTFALNNGLTVVGSNTNGFTVNLSFGLAQTLSNQATVTIGRIKLEYLSYGGSQGQRGPQGVQGAPGTQGISASFAGTNLPTNPYTNVDFRNGLHAFEGAPNTVYAEVNDNVVPFLTGATFSGKVSAPQLTGSLTRTQGGLAFIVGAGSVTATTNSSGQIIVSGSGGGAVTSLTGAGGTSTSASNGGTVYTVSSSVGADAFAAYLLLSASANDPNARTLVLGTGFAVSDGGPGGAYSVSTTGGGGTSTGWTDTGSGLFTTSSVSIDGGGQTAHAHGVDEWLYVSGTVGLTGSAAKKTVLAGDVVVSGSVTAVGTGGFTGSLTRTASGTAYLVPLGPGISISTGSSGQVTIANTRAGDDKASYVVMAATASLPNDRVLTPGTGITISDGGAGGNVTISATGQSLSTAGGWTDGGNKLFTTSSVSIDGQGRTADQVGSDIAFFVSGSIGNLPGTSGRKVADLPDTYVSGTLTAKQGLSGSLTTLADGTSYIVAGTGAKVTSASNGAVTIASPTSPSYGTFANRPTPGNAGRLYFVTDGPIAQWVDDGAAWHPLIMGQVIGTQPPLSSTFGSVNVSGTTITDISGSLLLTGPNDGSQTNIHAYTQNITGATTAYVEACIMNFLTGSSATSNDFMVSGLIMRESSTSKAVYLEQVTNNLSPSNAGAGYSAYLQVAAFSSNTVNSASISQMAPFENGPLFLRIRRDSAKVYADYSRDRMNWIAIAIYALGTAFTTAPDQVGIAISGFNRTPQAIVTHFASGSL